MLNSLSNNPIYVAFHAISTGKTSSKDKVPTQYVDETCFFSLKKRQNEKSKANVQVPFLLSSNYDLLKVTKGWFGVWLLKITKIQN